MVRAVKREPRSDHRGEGAAENAEAGTSDSQHQNTNDRRLLRSRYFAVKTLISDKRDDISRDDCLKFNSIIDEVDALHELVQRPREQVVDAEALLDLADNLETSVKAHGSGGITPSHFVSCILQQFTDAAATFGDNSAALRWDEIGRATCPNLCTAAGCCTMMGPMSLDPKPRKATVRRPRTKPTHSAKPEEIRDGAATEKTDTDKNMATMFDLLKKNRKVDLEKLILNRNSFAQTVENLFALSFLVKDGRASITVDQKGQHLVSPMNAPDANDVSSGKTKYSHFVFRFDFDDWETMKEMVTLGEELMPHRNPVGLPESEASDGATTPIRKLSRNRGLVLQEQAVEGSSEEAPAGGGGRLGKKARVKQ